MAILSQNFLLPCGVGPEFGSLKTFQLKYYPLVLFTDCDYWSKNPILLSISQFVRENLLYYESSFYFLHPVNLGLCSTPAKILNC